MRHEHTRAGESPLEIDWKKGSRRSRSISGETFEGPHPPTPARYTCSDTSSTRGGNPSRARIKESFAAFGLQAACVHVRERRVIENLGRRVAHCLHRQADAAGLLIDALGTFHIGHLAYAGHHR